MLQHWLQFTDDPPYVYHDIQHIIYISLLNSIKVVVVWWTRAEENATFLFVRFENDCITSGVPLSNVVETENLDVWIGVLGARGLALHFV